MIARLVSSSHAPLVDVMSLGVAHASPGPQYEGFLVDGVPPPPSDATSSKVKPVRVFVVRA